MTEYLKERLEGLKKFLAKCSSDMHGPDEQGISAHVIGDHLDNAMGEHISATAVRNGSQEFVVILVDEQGRQFLINLATLIALARKAK